MLSWNLSDTFVNIFFLSPMLQGHKQIQEHNITYFLAFASLVKHQRFLISKTFATAYAIMPFCDFSGSSSRSLISILTPAPSKTVVTISVVLLIMLGDKLLQLKNRCIQMAIHHSLLDRGILTLWQLL